MRIERINDKTVRCFISNEELEDFQIDYQDFVMRSEKAREVVRDIIEQATEEVGYKPPKYAFDMSIMVMPDQGLVLTFSENDPIAEGNGSKLMEYLKEMKRFVEQSAQGQEKALETKEEAGEERPQPNLSLFGFLTLRDVMLFADAVPKNLRVHSSLYCWNERYFLLLERGGASYPRYRKLCIQAMEFSWVYGAEEHKIHFMQQQGECLIAENALKKLRSDAGKKPAAKGKKKAAKTGQNNLGKA